MTLIYGLFRDGIYFCSALRQGAEEDGGQFDERGDERWIAAASSVQRACGRSDNDWYEISEEDFANYMLGSHGGDYDTGYIRDSETGLAVSAPARPFEVQLADTQNKYINQLQQLTSDFQNDLANAQLVGGDTDYVLESYQQNFNLIIQNSNLELMSIIEAAS